MYTNEWSNDVPSGSEQAKNIDNHFRRLRLDIFERLTSVFGDLDADPLVFQAPDRHMVAFYDGNAAGGARVEQYVQATKKLSLRYSGNTDNTAFIYIDLDEFTDEDAGYYHVNNIIDFHADIAQEAATVYPSNGQACAWQMDVPNNRIIIQVSEEDGDNVNNTAVKVWVNIVFRA